MSFLFMLNLSAIKKIPDKALEGVSERLPFQILLVLLSATSVGLGIYGKLAIKTASGAVLFWWIDA